MWPMWHYCNLQDQQFFCWFFCRFRKSVTWYSGIFAKQVLSQPDFHSRTFTAGLSQPDFHSAGTFTAGLSQPDFHSRTISDFHSHENFFRFLNFKTVQCHRTVKPYKPTSTVFFLRRFGSSWPTFFDGPKYGSLRPKFLKILKFQKFTKIQNF